jgi:hypothetical protein
MSDSSYQTIPHATWTRIERHDLEVYQNSGATLSVFIGNSDGVHFRSMGSTAGWRVRPAPEGRPKLNLSDQDLPALVMVDGSRSEWDLTAEPGSDGLPKWLDNVSDRELAIAAALLDLAQARVEDARRRLRVLGPVSMAAGPSEDLNARMRRHWEGD